MFRSIKPLFLTLVSLLALNGCSSLPEHLDSQAPNLISQYSAWTEDVAPQTPIRLGGIIANVENLADRTRVEVVNLPINSSGKPDITQEPEGRFVAYLAGFNDPVKLAQGRLVTLLGSTSGSEAGKVGEFEYTYPVMVNSRYHLWRIEERVIVNDINSYLYPCRSLHCRSMSHGTKQGKVIQEVK